MRRKSDSWHYWGWPWTGANSRRRRGSATRKGMVTACASERSTGSSRTAESCHCAHGGLCIQPRANIALRESPVRRSLHESTLLCSSLACYQRDTVVTEHILRRPVESQRAYNQRRKTLALGMVLALGLAAALAVLLVGCGGATSGNASATIRRAGLTFSFCASR